MYHYCSKMQRFDVFFWTIMANPCYPWSSLLPSILFYSLRVSIYWNFYVLLLLQLLLLFFNSICLHFLFHLTFRVLSQWVHLISLEKRELDSLSHTKCIFHLRVKHEISQTQSPPSSPEHHWHGLHESLGSLNKMERAACWKILVPLKAWFNCNRVCIYAINQLRKGSPLLPNCFTHFSTT